MVLKPGVHKHSDVWLPLAASVVSACYSERKPGVRILAAAGNLRPSNLKIAGPKGHRTIALKRRGGVGAALRFHESVNLLHGFVHAVRGPHRG